METLVKAILYFFIGLVVGAVATSLVTLLIGVSQQPATYIGAGVGALLGLGYGALRRFA